jgi:predicted ATP-dependent protease
MPAADSSESFLDKEDFTLFSLSSHQRAREAIQFALKMRNKGFHVFVVGDDRTGRMNSTLDFLNKFASTLPPSPDWVYLNNFQHPHTPLPFALPAGMGKKLQTHLMELIREVRAVLKKTLQSHNYVRQMDSLTATLQGQIDQSVFETQNFANDRGFEVVQTDDGFNIEQKNQDEIANQKYVQEIRERLNKLSVTVNLASQKIQKKGDELKRALAQKSISPLIQKFQEEFSVYLEGWIDDLKADILKHVDDFMDSEGEDSKPTLVLDEWYGVNLFVHHHNTFDSKVYLEPNPTYENLFGSIKYRTNTNGSVETNFTMVRPGALHLANGGMLILRADALANNPDAWEALKGALRDKVIRIEERVRESSLPLLDAPQPKSIPLDVQVFLVASPYWYYNFFFEDPDFRTYFKVKAEIDPDLPATPQNVYVYKKLIHQNAQAKTGIDITDKAVDYLMGHSARWVGHRERLSARFELIFDILMEAGVLTEHDHICENSIRQVLHNRRLRNARLEEVSLEDISSRQVLIDTRGRVVGQVNGLTVLSTGDHEYGMPSRITARTYVGDEGVVNIERLTDMGGPIQQKGMLIIEGFLKGLFAQSFPLSCACSLTFEQNYGGVEGDSASMAEVVAILSSLSGFPVRQDMGITGSMNQFGMAQSVGGIHFKVEGFHAVCCKNGLTGTQGVILPQWNDVHLTLRENVVADIEQGKFSVWTVQSVFEAMELMLEKPCGVPLENGIPKLTGKTVFARGSILEAAFSKLKKYHGGLKRQK